ncbi:Peptidase M23 [Tepidanaerobacter acetatoxydans Re1]|uniref:Peptidase M23 n=1 Tax=Tepidanaerobacter acetatoxydans (strain DSM 21804 / JCM 16047 / Re1) TaxID=1209989 RepID=F4LV78_TEPAE|nr:M23 family metallopeptidase [Tepidanaerobacter acetatoxydans]AEE92725.1 Peptidase M23 [Tepidanaerobacter acetatoxydans Re1]CDI41095.1 Peptidase M23 [Tepidanaerobacter acetatoxydans Re1]
MNERKEKFTMMVIPHSGKSTFAVSVSAKTLKIAGGLLAATLIGVMIFVSNIYLSYNKFKTRTEELSVIAKDYNVLQKQLEFFVEKTSTLEKKMSELEKLDTDLRGLLEGDPALKTSIKKEDKQLDMSRAVITSRSGLDRQRAISQLRILELKIPDQEQSLEELKDAVIQRNDRLSHTPSGYPVSGNITSKFGYRKSPFGSRQEFHDGLDIGASYGATIVATADGMVTFTGYRSGYGRTVTISHGYGFETSYCHNSSILVKTGQQVKKGQGIAKVGSSGRSTGPHLHYMVRLNGQLQDPANFLQ